VVHKGPTLGGEKKKKGGSGQGDGGVVKGARGIKCPILEIGSAHLLDIAGTNIQGVKRRHFRWRNV